MESGNNFLVFIAFLSLPIVFPRVSWESRNTRVVMISTQLKKTQKYLLPEKNLALKFQICTNKIRKWNKTTDIYCIQMWNCEPSASNLSPTYGQLMMYQPEICQKPTKTEFPQNFPTQKYFQQCSVLLCCKTICTCRKLRGGSLATWFSIRDHPF